MKTGGMDEVFRGVAAPEAALTDQENCAHPDSFLKSKILSKIGNSQFFLLLAFTSN